MGLRSGRSTTHPPMKDTLKFAGKVLLVLAAYKVVKSAAEPYVPAAVKPWLP